MKIIKIAWLTIALILVSSYQVYASDGGNFGFPRPEGDAGPPECGDPPCVPQGAPDWAVNMVNMNLFVQDIPIWYDSPVGPDIESQLSYNSMTVADENELFGNKWTFGYTSYLEVDVDGNVTITMPTGRKDMYTSDAGGYINPLKEFHTLTRISATNYELELTSGTVFVYNHDASALQKVFLSDIYDTRNNTVTLNYDTNNRLISAVDSLNKTTTFSYNSSNLVDQIDDPFGRSAAFEYDTNRNLTKIEDMGGYETSFEYDANGLLSAIINDAGRTEFYTEPADQLGVTQDYPAPGEEMKESYRITVTFPDGSKEEYYYNCNSAKSWYVAPEDFVEYKNVNWNNFTLANKTQYIYESTAKGLREEIKSITYPGGEKEVFGYDYDSSLVSYSADAEDNQTEYTYNAKGRVTTKTSPSGVVNTYVYEANGVDLARIETGLGNKEYFRNSYREITEVKNRQGKSTYYDYNSLGQLIRIIDPLSIETDFIYNSTTHLLEEIQKDSQVLAQFTYDSVGRVQTSIDATGLQLTYGYDDLNHLISITYPDSKTVSYEYNSPASPHLITRTVERSGREWFYEYDALKQLQRVINPEKGVLQYNYDGNKNLVEFIDPNSNVTSYEYSLDNRVTRKIYADSSSVSYDYFNTGLLKKRTSGRGINSYYEYDEDYNLLSVQYSDETPAVSFIYDNYSRLTDVVDGLGSHVISYNADSQLTGIDGPLADDSITYHYDDSGRRTGIDILGGEKNSVVYTLDDINRMTKITVGSDEYVYTYPDTKNPLIDKLIRPSGAYTAYQYDDLNRLTGVINSKANADLINSYIYTYNNQDLRDSETVTNGLDVTGPEEGLKEFEHNELNQLLSETNPGRNFQYDGDGNLVEAYTPDGNLFTANYDAENRLASVEFTDSDSSLVKKVYSYRWDDFLGRIRVYKDNYLTSDTRIVRGESLALQDRSGNNSILREYVWGQNLGGGIGGLLNLFVEDFADYHYFYDGKGNVTTLLDGFQNPGASYSYNTFGRLMQKTGTDQPFQFSTKRYDPDTGLSYYGYRFYSPVAERWMNRDPLGEAGGINLYQFVGSDPVNWIDPNGLTVSSTAGKVGTAIISGTATGAGTISTGPGIIIGIIAAAISPSTLGDGTLPPGMMNEGEDEGECPNPDDIPDFDFNDPTKPPTSSDGTPWEWKGQPPQGGPKGGYKNPDGPKSMHPDLDHGDPVGPHWDYNDRKGPGYRIKPDGSIESK